MTQIILRLEKNPGYPRLKAKKLEAYSTPNSHKTLAIRSRRSFSACLLSFGCQYKTTFFQNFTKIRLTSVETVRQSISWFGIALRQRDKENYWSILSIPFILILQSHHEHSSEPCLLGQRLMPPKIAAFSLTSFLSALIHFIHP